MRRETHAAIGLVSGPAARLAGFREDQMLCRTSLALSQSTLAESLLTSASKLAAGRWSTNCVGPVGADTDRSFVATPVRWPGPINAIASRSRTAPHSFRFSTLGSPFTRTKPTR
jgi:hypothetical protein